MGGILDQDIKFLPGVGPQRKVLLAKELGIETYADLLAYYPYKYVDRSKVYPIRELNSEMPFVQVKGRILSFEQYDMGGRKKRLVAHFSDGTGVVDLVWFTYVQHAQKTYKIGVEYVVFGRPGIYGGRFQFAHPEMEEVTKQLSLIMEDGAVSAGEWDTLEEIRKKLLEFRRRADENLAVLEKAAKIGKFD